MKGANQYRLYGDIETFTQTSEGQRGQIIGDWVTTYSGVPMGITELTGRQLELAHQLVATATHKISLRWINGIVPTSMRILFNNRIFKISHVNEFDFRNRYLELTCEEQKTGAD